MIKSGWFPTRRVMTSAAFLAKTALMGIVFQVAGAASSRRSFKISFCVCINMAFFTCHTRMFAIQLENRLAVIKILTNGFTTVMTPTTIRSIRLSMNSQESAVNLLMASTANRLIKTGNIDCVAINTGKSPAIAAFPMGSQ